MIFSSGNKKNKDPYPTQNAIITILKGIEGFDSLSNSQLDKLIDKFDIVTYEYGDLIIAQGRPGFTMHILLSGKVKVTFVDEKGGRYDLNRLTAGDIFGEMSLLTDNPRSANVIAESSVTTCVLEKQSLMELLGFHPNIARFFTRILRERIDRDKAMGVGTYVINEEMGQGSIAIVYKGRCNLGRDVAIKMLKHERARGDQFRKAIFEEAKFIAQLRHPNIIQLYGIEEAYGTYFIIMEFLNGIDLKKYLMLRPPLNPLEIMDVVSQLGSALQFAHAHGIVHRDVKPSNCIISHERGQLKVTITDFGLAFNEYKNAANEDGVIGTPYYISPEAVQSESIDFRADIYALGVIAYQLVTGEVPFDADSVQALLSKHVEKEPPEIKIDIPKGLRVFIQQAMKKNPEKRISNWDQILSLLSINGHLIEKQVDVIKTFANTIIQGKSTYNTLFQLKKASAELMSADIEIFRIIQDDGLHQLEQIKSSKESEYVEIKKNSSVEIALSTGHGLYILNRNYTVFPASKEIEHVTTGYPGYAILPVSNTLRSVYGESGYKSITNEYTKELSLETVQIKKGVSGIILILFTQEEYNERVLINKLNIFKNLILYCDYLLSHI